MTMTATIASIRQDLLRQYDPAGAVLLCISLCAINWAIWRDQQLEPHIADLLQTEYLRAAAEFGIYGAIVGACFMSGVMSIRGLKDPDDRRNKIVRVYRIDPPWEGKDFKGGKYAVLVEFAVSKINTDGLAVEVSLSSPYLKNLPVVMRGPARFTHRPKRVGMQSDGLNVPEFLVGDYVFRKCIGNHSATPSMSLYYYFEANEKIEPLEILYFANQANALKVESAALKIGKAYKRKDV